MIGPVMVLWGAFAAALLIALAAGYAAYVAGRAVVRATAGYRRKLAYVPRHAVPRPVKSSHQPRHARPGVNVRLSWPHGHHARPVAA